MSLGLGLAVSAVVFAVDYGRQYHIMRCVCDGFFVAAVMLFGIGGLRSIRNKGLFDVAEFGVKSVVETAMPYLRRDDRKETIHEFRERKAEERKSGLGLILAGLTYLALSLITMAVYYWMI